MSFCSGCKLIFNILFTFFFYDPGNFFFDSICKDFLLFQLLFQLLFFVPKVFYNLLFSLLFFLQKFFLLYFFMTLDLKFLTDRFPVALLYLLSPASAQKLFPIHFF